MSIYIQLYSLYDICGIIFKPLKAASWYTGISRSGTDTVPRYITPLGLKLHTPYLMWPECQIQRRACVASLPLAIARRNYLIFELELRTFGHLDPWTCRIKYGRAVYITYM